MIISKSSSLPSAAHAVEALPPRFHKMDLPAIQKVCETAKEILSKKSDAQGCQYLKNELLINFDEKSYSLLLPKNLFFREGSQKKVTSAIKIRETETGITATPYVRIAAKKGFTISEKEIAHEKKYGNLEDLTYYEGKDKIQKLTYLQKRYDHDVFEFVFEGYGDKKNYSCEVLNVLLGVGKKIKQMHADNVVHRDIKCLNTFYSHSETENDEVFLGDFGLTYAPLTEEKTGYETLYGSPVYTAPERLDEMVIQKKQEVYPIFRFNPDPLPGEKTVHETPYGSAVNIAPRDPAEIETPKNQKEDLLEQAKAEDMYAIGCEMYQLIFEKDFPWLEEIEKFIKNPTEENRNELSSKQTRTMWALETYIEKAANGPAKKLLSCLKDLLAEDPNTRMKIDTFMDTLSEISASLTSESVWIPVGSNVSREVKLMKIITEQK